MSVTGGHTVGSGGSDIRRGRRCLAGHYDVAVIAKDIGVETAWADCKRVHMIELADCGPSLKREQQGGHI